MNTKASQKGYRGRGVSSNPGNRFEALHIEVEPTEDDPPARRIETQYLRDVSKTVISKNNSPDVGFDFSINPYRGCEHGCSYCYARPTHEYLGFSSGLDFETRILVKEDAPELLRRELSSKRWKGAPLALSGVTDPYQPIERKLEVTRRCLEVLAAFRNPIVIITKNFMVIRDLDYLTELARHRAAIVTLSVTTLDAGLQRSLEPRASSPVRRLEAIRLLAQAGVRVRVLVAPVIPGLNDHEIPRVLTAAAEAGAEAAGFVLLRLPYQQKSIFVEWLEKNVPERAARVLARVEESRGGQLYDSSFHQRMKGTGKYAEQIHGLFHGTCRRLALNVGIEGLSSDAFRRPGTGQQGNLF